tara:strand:+ start:89 stop:730 length:642 start_codon:yes stop_codon:yes gene_type:complete
MSYQGHAVNFSQSSSFERAVGMEIGNINTALYTYPQRSNLASAKSDTDIWNHLNRYVWGKSGSQSSPQGSWSADPNAIVPNIKKNTNAIQQLDTAVRQIISQGTGGGMTRQQVENIVEEYHGDDIELLHNNAMSLGNSQQAAKAQRDSMEAKIQSNKDEHSDFHTKLTDLGIALQGHSDSPHNQGGGGGIMSYLPLIAVGGIAAYLLKGKLKL